MSVICVQISYGILEKTTVDFYDKHDDLDDDEYDQYDDDESDMILLIEIT